MKILIVYASKYGCTRDCAKYLVNKISSDVTLVDINKPAEKVEINAFDKIIIGGSVYVGKISKKLRDFCESNLDVLVKKDIGIFLCCALHEEMEESLKNSFPAALLQAARITKSFGSEARLDKMSFVDKTIIKAVTKGDFSSFKISDERMDEFAKVMGQ